MRRSRGFGLRRVVAAFAPWVLVACAGGVASDSAGERASVRPPDLAGAVASSVPGEAVVASTRSASVPEIVPLDPKSPVDDRLPPPEEPIEHPRKAWPFDIQAYEIALRLDPSHHAISGRMKIDVEVKENGVAELPLDAVDLEIRHVWTFPRPTSVRGADWGATFQFDFADETSLPPGEELRFTYDGRILGIPLDPSGRVGTQRSFVVEYSGHPHRGIYFNDAEPRQVFTQGEMEDSRYWFPCHDAPDDRAPHMLAVGGVPPNWKVVGAGHEGRTGIGTTFGTHSYWIDTPHVSYLTTMVAGEYEILREHGVVPLEYVVAPDQAQYARQNFAKTDAVLRFFGDFTGLPYPYPKYAQTVVRDFMFGGMENISATTLTDRTIHPPDWEPARSSTGLIAHEAAHQWFGDWITCVDWSHCWLNEGFASYFDLLFTEHDEGRDAFLWDLRGTRRGGLGAMDGERRAVVSSKWVKPMDMFDGHAYPGGAARIHMLRHLLGDDAFREAIRHYVKKCGLQCITTDDFRRAIEESCGRDLSWFFDQWFMKPGYPLLAMKWRWNESASAMEIEVEQKHKTDDDAPAAYVLPLDVAFDFKDGRTETKRLDVSQRKETFAVKLPSRPELVRPDPETALMARFEVDRPLDEWEQILRHDPNPALRRDAADALEAIVKDEKKPAADRDRAGGELLLAFNRDTFPRMRASLAAAIASRKDGELRVTIRASLIHAMDADPDLRVRIAATDALQNFENDDSANTALASHLQDDNDLMRSSAVSGIAKLKRKGAFDALVAALDRPGWQSVARTAALRGFAELGDERALPVLLQYAAPGSDELARGAAIDGLGRMGKKKPAIRDALIPWLDDPRREIRSRAASALGAVGDPDVIPLLLAKRTTETWSGVKDALAGAVKACRAQAVEEGRLVTLEAVRGAEIRDRHAAKRDDVEAAEKALPSLSGDAKADAEKRLAAQRKELDALKKDLDLLGIPPKPKPAAAPPSAAPSK